MVSPASITAPSASTQAHLPDEAAATVPVETANFPWRRARELLDQHRVKTEHGAAPNAADQGKTATVWPQPVDGCD